MINAQGHKGIPAVDGQDVWDVVIIGAGMAGLTASVYLARAGQKVLLLEKAALPGGRAMTSSTGGARLNLGPHALYKTALGILREVGVEPSGASPKLTPSFIFGSEGDETAVQTLGLLWGSFLKWAEKGELIRFFSRIRKIDTAELQNVSLQHYLEAYFRSPKVRQLIESLARLATFCNAPELLSAGAVIRQLQYGEVLYVHDGWQTMVEALRNQALQAGVTIRCDAPVRKIAGSFPHMSVALKDGVTLGTRHVLSTAGPRETLAMLEEPVPPFLAEAYNRLTPVRAACLDLVMDGVPNPKPSLSLGTEHPWYFSNHSATAKFTDSPEHAVVHVMKYLHPEDATAAADVELELERFLDLIQPGWRKNVVMRRFLPHMTVSNAVVTAQMGGLAGRPGPMVEGRPGLYVAGDWVGSEGMLLNASLASAKEAAHCIIMDKGTNRDGMRHGA